MKLYVLGMMFVAQGLPSYAHASSAPFYVFDLPTKFFGGGQSEDYPSNNPLIDVKALNTYLPVTAQEDIKQTFDEELQADFPEAYRESEQIGNPRGGSSRLFNYRYSFAAVLNLTRISEYVIHQPVTTVVYVPVTFSIQFINPGTGEVVVSRSSTVYSGIEIAQSQLLPQESARLVGAVRENVNHEVSALLRDCAMHFHPNSVKASVARTIAGLVVLDKGVEGGVAEGDLLISEKENGRWEIAILSSEQGYSVGWERSGAIPDPLSVFFKYDVKPADDAAKPRVLPVVQSGDGIDERLSAAQLFSDDLGYGTNFTLTPASPSFESALKVIDESTNIGNETVIQKRRAPSFFMRFMTAVTPPFGLFNPAIPDRKEVHFISAVFAQILDAGGNVLFSSYGSDSYSYIRNGDTGMSEMTARQIALKNAVKSLTENFSKNLRFKQNQLPVTAPFGDPPGMVRVIGAGNSLNVGAKVMIFRDAGFSVAGNRVFLPLEQARVDQSSDDAVLRLLGPSASTVHSTIEAGDMVRFTSIDMPSTGGGGMRMVKCDEAPILSLSSLKADYVAPMLENALFHGSKDRVAIFDPDYQKAANKLIQSGFAADQAMQMSDTSNNYCYKPLYLIRTTTAQCAPDVCDAQLTEGGGLMFIRNGQKQTVQAGLAVNLTGFAVDDRDAYFLWDGFGRFEKISAEIEEKLRNR